MTIPRLRCIIWSVTVINLNSLRAGYNIIDYCNAFIVEFLRVVNIFTAFSLFHSILVGQLCALFSLCDVEWNFDLLAFVPCGLITVNHSATENQSITLYSIQLKFSFLFRQLWLDLPLQGQIFWNLFLYHYSNRLLAYVLKLLEHSNYQVQINHPKLTAIFRVMIRTSMVIVGFHFFVPSRLSRCIYPDLGVTFIHFLELQAFVAVQFLEWRHLCVSLIYCRPAKLKRSWKLSTFEKFVMFDF